MSIFAPQNVMGPAHRGGVIQQLAQGAAQNVMRRQKLKSLLMHTAGRAGGSAVGGGQPFRASTQGHATGAHGSVFRGPGPGGGPGVFGGTSALSRFGGDFANPDPGPADLPSLPDPTDPAQSPSSTQPTPPLSGYGPSGTSGIAPDGTYIGDAAYSAQFPQDDPDSLGAMADTTPPGVGEVAAGYIPLGGGQFYHPATDTVVGGRKPGLQQ